MLGWLALIIGLLVLLGVCWYRRKTIKSFFKKNKKKVAAVAVAGGMIGTGGMAIISDEFVIPEGYRPALATMIQNSNGKYWEATAANIQLAIWDLNSTGGIVWLPGETTFTVDSQIDISDSDIRITGAGSSTVLQMGNDANLATGMLWLNYGISNIQIDNMRFDGNKDQQTSDGTSVYITLNNNVKILNCDFIDNYKNGIKAYSNTINTPRDIIISNCYLSGNNESSISLSKYWNNVTVDSCTISNSCYSNVSNTGGVYANNGNNIVVSNNVIRSMHGSSYNIAGVHLRNVKGATISGNSINGCEANSILCYLSESVSITGNSIQNGNRSGVYLEAAYKTTCSNNVINLCNGSGIIAGGWGDDYTNNSVISGNVITSIGVTGILSSSRNITIIGNKIRNTGIKSSGYSYTYASILHYGKNSVISNNHITNDSGHMEYGISDRLAGGTLGRNNYIHDNYIHGFNTSGIYSAGANTIIKDNIGYDYSNYHATPFGTSTPYSSNWAGGTWLDTVNDILYIWDGSYDLTFEANVSGTCRDKPDGDPFFNASDAFGFEWGMADGWNESSDGNPFDQVLNTTSDVDFLSVTADGSGLSGVLHGWTDGDPFFNASDAFPLTAAWMAAWNLTNIFDQQLNTTDAATFATLDTGQGANELYDMDQNVLTTSTATFENLASTNTFNVTGLTELEGDLTIDDANLNIENGAYTWVINVNSTGCMVWEWS